MSINNRDFGLFSTGSGGGGGGGTAVIILGSGANSSVRCGVGNCASGTSSGALSGKGNTASNGYSIVAGGTSNTASGVDASILGGNSNTASGCRSTVVGGCLNTASFLLSTIVGGGSNCNSGTAALIGSGCLNTVSGTYDAILSGSSNTINGVNSAIITGQNNIICSTASFIGTGVCNNCIGSASNYSFIGTGVCNFLTQSNNFVITGGNNTIGGFNSGVINGVNNDVQSSFSLVTGSNNCTCGGGACYQEIIGSNNTLTSICSCYNSISGCYNSMSNSIRTLYNSISGYCNSMTTTSTGQNTVLHSRIFGVNNTICIDSSSGYYGKIVNAQINGNGNLLIYLTTSNYDLYYHSIINGFQNCICYCNAGAGTPLNRYNTIINGTQNKILDSTFSTLTGYENIDCEGSFNSLFGCCNISTLGSCYNFMYGELNCSTSNHSSVIGCSLCNNVGCSLLTNQLRAANLCGGGTLCANSYGTIELNPSDIRYKTNICNIDYGMNTISSLNPVSFYWCDEHKKNKGCNKQLGLVAQEVRCHIPEAISENIDGLLTLDYNKITPVIIKSLQELDGCIKKIECCLNI